MQIVAAVWRVSIVLILAGVLHSCGGDRSPVAPTTPVTPAPVPATLLRLEIVGPRSVAPGESVQFLATGHYSDGSSRDVTSQASWSSQRSGILTVDATGRATGRDFGESALLVRAGGRSATTEVVIVPAGTFRLSVIAREAGVFALEVRVEVVSGRGTGLFDATPVSGRYDLYGVEGDTQIRVSGSGYVDHVQRVMVAEHTVLTADLTLARPRHDPSGTYRLTITADPACADALPAEARVRRYGAAVSQFGPEIRVALTEATFRVAEGRGDRFAGRVDGSGSRAAFSLAFLNDSYGGIYTADVVESLGGSQYLVLKGEAVTSIWPSTLAGVFSGSMDVWDIGPGFYNSRRIASCPSTQHRFVLSR